MYPITGYYAFENGDEAFIEMTEQEAATLVAG
jgi:hypothetical protein